MLEQYQLVKVYIQVTRDLLIGIPAKLIKRSLRLKYRWAGFLGLWAGTFWLVHRRPAKKVPGIISMLRKK